MINLETNLFQAAKASNVHLPKCQTQKVQNSILDVNLLKKHKVNLFKNLLNKHFLHIAATRGWIDKSDLITISSIRTINTEK